MALAEEMLKYVIRFVLEQAPQEMEFFNRFIDTSLLQRLQHVLDSSFERVSYTRAVELLQKAEVKFNFPPEWGKDLQTEHERYLSEKIFQKPVFVTDYPKGIKAFYMRLNDDGRTVAAMDLLVPDVGEIIGGSQREERYDVLKSRIAEMGLKSEDYEWYLNLRKFGGAPHAGFGLGFERAVMYLTGMENIRDVIPYPRTPKSAEF
jgi:asparaginyl-tRNA synthetase